MILYNKALRSYIFTSTTTSTSIYVSYSWLNGWTEWAHMFRGNPGVPRG